MVEPMRHIDDGSYPWHYQQSLVRCIRCDTPGQIGGEWYDVNTHSDTEKPHRYWNKTFNCINCQLSLSANNGDWVSTVTLTASAVCYHCGSPLVGTSEQYDAYYDNLPSTVNLSCTMCPLKKQPMPNIHPIYDGSLGVDRDFGLPLYLRVPCRFGMVWAYNQEHLDILRDFIQATLRERTRESGNGSLFSRLPAWIKSAKNRDMLLKKLAQLQKKADAYKKAQSKR